MKTTFLFFVWAVWILFNFHLKQKQSSSLWSFTENASFISFHEGIWSITFFFNFESKNSDQIKIILTNMFNTKYSLVPNCRRGKGGRGCQTAFYLTSLQLGTKEYYIKYNNKCTSSCFVFSFLHNFKLKTEVVID